MHIVLSLGGSLVNTENGTDTEYLAKINGIISKCIAKGNKFGIVVGGGFAARKKANKLRTKGKNEFECDEAAIKITWKNAKSVIAALGGSAYPKVIKDFYKARKLAMHNNVVVMGGTIPGITTDTDSVLLAEAIGAKQLVNISNTDGIYDSDPRKNPTAKKFDRLDYHQLIHIACEYDTRKAGENFVFDILACKLIARSKIETHFVSGHSLNDLENAIDGKAHNGTIVKEI